jgi:Zn/Cd-binding protein ZinT
MFNLLKRVKEKEVKNIFEGLLENGGEYFDGSWIEKNLDSIKRMFVKMSNLEVWTNAEGINTPYRKDYIKDIVLSDNKMTLFSRNDAVTLNMPSEGCIIIEKGAKNNRYAMYLYGKKDSRPSQIILSYHNI